MQGRNGDPDAQDRAVGMVAGWGGLGDGNWHIYATMCERDSLWEPAVMHRKLSWVLCDDLEQWSGSSGREAQKGGDICIYAAD